MSENGNLFGDLPDQRAPITISQSGLDPVWTEHKAQLIALYLRYFVYITHHGAYIDGFAGPKLENVPNSWAAELVVRSEPRRLRQFFLCDLTAKGCKALQKLVDDQDDKNERHYRVLQGDFNQTIDAILASGKITDKVATFCLLDQFSTECHWQTLKKLAGHKAAGSRKIELFYFLATGWLGRALSGFTKNVDEPEKWWGNPDWKQLKGKAGDIIAIRIAERFRDELGYRHVAAYPIWQKEKGQGKVMFHMIHASDHPAAAELMRRAHRQVTKAPEPDEQLAFELGHLVENDLDQSPAV